MGAVPHRARRVWLIQRPAGRPDANLPSVNVPTMPGAVTVTRVAKNGYVAEVRRVRDIPALELDQIVRVTDSWLGGQTEHGFSMATVIRGLVDRFLESQQPERDTP